MQGQIISTDEFKEKPKIDIHPAIKRGLPGRGTYLNLNGIIMVVLSMSDKQGTLHLRTLSTLEIAEIVAAKKKLTDEQLAELGKEEKEKQ